MLQDGSYTVTDEDGRYHFEGVRPGLHVVQIDPSTLPLDAKRSTAPALRKARARLSRFVEGRGGALKRADFTRHRQRPRAAPKASSIVAPTVSATPKPRAVGLAAGKPRASTGCSPPRSQPALEAIRAGVKHAPGQTVSSASTAKPSTR